MDFRLKLFEWRRCESGHVIDRTGKEPVLIEQSAARLSCLPLAESNEIFRQFAALQTSTSPESSDQRSHDEGVAQPGMVVGFADKYGLLTAPDDAKAKKLRQSEPLDLWVEEVGAMRHAVSIWDGIGNDDEEFLSQHFCWEPAGAGEYRATYSADGELWMHIPDLPPQRRPRDDLSEPARFWLLTEINKKVSESAPALCYQSDVETFEFALKPPDLQTAIWTRFLKAVLDDNEWKQCEECGRWIEISPATARISRQFCSNACKVKSYRQRKMSAVALRQKGKSVRAIAKELGSDVETVRGWIKGTNGG
jgi:ferredoxin